MYILFHLGSLSPIRIGASAQTNLGFRQDIFSTQTFLISTSQFLSSDLDLVVINVEPNSEVCCDSLILMIYEITLKSNKTQLCKHDRLVS